MNRNREALGTRRTRVSITVAIALVVGWALLGGLAREDQTLAGDAGALIARQESGAFAASTAPGNSRLASRVSPKRISDPDARERAGVYRRHSSTSSESVAQLTGTVQSFNRASLEEGFNAGGRDGVETGWFEADGHDTAAESEGTDPAEIDNPADILERNGHISGSVLDQFGMPVAGIGLVATVRNLPPLPDSVRIPTEYLQYRAVSDVDGRYRFSRIIDGDYSVSTVSNGQYANAHINVRSGSTLANIVLSREQSIVVSGQVVTDTGEPLWGALVTPLVPGVSGAYTDGGGAYQLAASFAETRGGVGLKARLDGYREQMILLSSSDLGKGSITANFVLEPVASVAVVTGRIHGADGNMPLAGVSVQLRSSQLNRIYRTVTGSAGEFLLSGVETGDNYQLLASSSGYQDFVQERIQVNSSGLNLDIALDRASQNSLYAQVSNLGGEAIPGYTLNVRSARPPFNTRQVTSDGGGRFAIHGVSAGPVIFEKQAYPQISISGVDVTDNVDEHVQIVVDWGMDEINGVVVDKSGHPVGGSTVVLTWSHSANGIQSWSTRQTVADAQGSFGFRELGPGPHTLVVEAQGFGAKRLAHDVTTDGYEVVVKLDSIAADMGSGT